MRRRPKNSGSRITWRENIGSVGIQRTDSSIAARTMRSGSPGPKSGATFRKTGGPPATVIARGMGFGLEVESVGVKDIINTRGIPTRMGSRIFHGNVVFALGPEANHHITVSHAQNFSWREGHMGDLIPLLGDGLLTIDGDFHRRIVSNTRSYFHRVVILVPGDPGAGNPPRYRVVMERR